MFKRIVLLNFVCILLISNFIFANKLSDNYYSITNPTNYNLQVVNKEGKLLLSGVNKQSTAYLIYDIFDNKPKYMYKKYEGEEVLTKTQNYDDGSSWTYKDALERVEIYDLEKNFLFEISGFSNLYSSNDFIIYSNEGKCYIYNINDKNIETLDFDTYEKLGNDKIVFHNYSNDKNRVTEIYDKNLNKIKSYSGYNVNYSINIKGKQYMMLFKMLSDNDFRYNFIDENGDMLFDNDVENRMDYDDEIIEYTFLYDDKKFIYDFEKNEYIKKPITISTEEKEELKNKLMPNISFKEEEDPIKDKIKNELKDESLYVENRTFDGKKIYFVRTKDEFIDDTNSDEGRYVSYYNIYDNEGHLMKENINNLDVQASENGFIIISGKVYDFNFNELLDIKSDTSLREFKIDYKTYYLDKYDDNSNEKDIKNLFDSKMQFIFKDVDDIVIADDGNFIFVTDNKNTKMYDKNFQVIKELNRNIEPEQWQFNEKSIVFFDKNTNRYGVIDNKGNILVDKLKKIQSLEEDYIVYQNGFRYGIMDLSGNVIVSLSIFDDIKEDAIDKDYDLGYVEE